ncbi:MAG: hypothetical protein HOG03_13715, partial [Desulfobacula sp.]|nr:hypothetical protein [Desulfobacula sp.]
MAEDLTHFEIKQYLLFLDKYLPSNPTSVNDLYTLPKKLDYAFNGSTKQKESTLQKIAEHMGFYLGLLAPIKIHFKDKNVAGRKSETIFYGDKEGTVSEETKSTYTEEIKYAGLYKIFGPEHREIVIVNDTSFYLTHFLSVLAHEVTHNYLYQHKIKPPENFDNEILTDLAATYLGFGPTLMRGYAPSEATHCLLGYVNTTTILRAIIISYYYRNWEYYDTFKKFEWFEIYRYKLFFFLLPFAIKKRFNMKKDKGEIQKVIIECQNCLNKMRIPLNNKLLKIVCPHCDFE